MPFEPRSLAPRSEPDLRVWAPLRGGVFRAVWIAAVCAIGAIWMQDVGAGWLMKGLTGGDPLMVALVQAATSLPVMLLVVPAGTLGDLVDRRRFLLWALGWLALTSAAMTLLSLGRVDPAWLLALTLAAGAGKAMILPGFAAAGAELAARNQLHQAVGLHSVANNAGRIVGPGLAGALVVAAGVPAVFGATLAAFLLGWLLVASVPRDSFTARSAASQGFVAALVDGLRHCWHDLVFRRVALRVATFFLCAIGVHALLPLLVTDAHWFGIGWAFYGVGAIAGALCFPRLATRLDAGRQLTLGIALHAAMLAALSLVGSDLLRTALLLVTGAAWYVVVSAGQLAVQRELPDALRARGMAVFTIVMMAGFVAGAVLWGATARAVGVATTLQAVAATSLAGLVLTARLRLARPAPGGA
ncbi:MAG: MFS transporter [Steroidobacteraceae bacterium]|jgi:MFS family permease|nr:MFS transporter [Steroidobacteraceae bacterium]